MGQGTFLTSIPVYPLLHIHPNLYIDFFHLYSKKYDRSLRFPDLYDSRSLDFPTQRYGLLRFAQFRRFYEFTTNIF